MIHFCTFGNDASFSNSKRILIAEARASGYFDTFHVYNDSFIPPEHRTFVSANPRGYGYMIWKPMVILDVMRKTQKGDIVIFADAGCGISTTSEARAKYKEWIQNVKTHPPIAFPSKWI